MAPLTTHHSAELGVRKVEIMVRVQERFVRMSIRFAITSVENVSARAFVAGSPRYSATVKTALTSPKHSTLEKN